mmetsp:Transcript_60983/g.163574  ORF Transcript_60983/g.163574 Transcript_60983/m.163574 type:complete len:277 (-) Transcript_60983:6-836(-)
MRPRACPRPTTSVLLAMHATWMRLRPLWDCRDPPKNVCHSHGLHPSEYLMVSTWSQRGIQSGNVSGRSANARCSRCKAVSQSCGRDKLVRWVMAAACLAQVRCSNPGMFKKSAAMERSASSLGSNDSTNDASASEAPHSRKFAVTGATIMLQGTERCMLQYSMTFFSTWVRNLVTGITSPSSPAAAQLHKTIDCRAASGGIRSSSPSNDLRIKSFVGNCTPASSAIRGSTCAMPSSTAAMGSSTSLSRHSGKCSPTATQTPWHTLQTGGGIAVHKL